MEILSKMLEAMVVTLREGVEAALLVGIVLAYLKKSNKDHLRRYVYRGLGAAILVSLLGALVVQKLGLDPENEMFEGTLMLVAAAFVGSLLIWMWRTGRTLKQRMETRLSAATIRGSGLALFLFTFLMILREGIETVLFLSALSGAIGANPLYNFLGGGLGLLLAFFFGFLLVKGSLRLNLKTFFATTGFVLVLLVFKLIANGLHEFFEAGLLPSSEAILQIVGFLTKESTSVAILIALLALPALSMLQEAWGKPLELDSSRPLPEQRKIKAEVRRQRRWTTAAAAVALGISYLLGVSLVVSANRGFDPAPIPLLFQETIRIPLGDLGAPGMAKYTVNLDGVDVRFFIVRNHEGKVAVALDACNLCPLKGYHLDGEQVVCHNCGAPIAFDTIGTPGGCNPVPLKAVVEKDDIVVSAQALVEGRARFAHRK
jgi:high-affinity iron transporter